MQLPKLPSFLLLVFCIVPGYSFYLVRPLFHDNYHYNPAISPFPGSDSIFRMAQPAADKQSADLPDSLSSRKRQDFPLTTGWRWPSRFPY